jgi:hypothetical protein
MAACKTKERNKMGKLVELFKDLDYEADKIKINTSRVRSMRVVDNHKSQYNMSEPRQPPIMNQDYKLIARLAAA